jgi:mRNA-degrading endonuclease RelE of RelBE toxin-antitoxin system
LPHTPTVLQFAKPLAGSQEHRFRIGDYRAIFEMLHGTLQVIAIKRRDEARSFNRQTA